MEKIDWREGSLVFELKKQKFRERKLLEVFDELGKIKVFKTSKKIKVIHQFENYVNSVEGEIKNLKINQVAITWSERERKIKIFVNGEKIAENIFDLPISYIG